MSISVIVCCQVHTYAEGICCILENDKEINLIGFACTDKEIANLMSEQPDVIISDTACHEAVFNRKTDKGNKNILLINDTGEIETDAILNMINIGLGGLLPKDADSHHINMAIRKIAKNELWIDRHTMGEALSRKTDRKKDLNLTRKEVEILHFVCEGMTNKEIAKELYISEQTVKSHCNHLFKKFKVKNRLKLALKAPVYFPEINRSRQLH